METTVYVCVCVCVCDEWLNFNLFSAWVILSMRDRKRKICIGQRIVKRKED